MIFYLRRFLLTAIMLVVAIIWDDPLPIDVAAVAAAVLLDILVSNRSKDLILYRKDFVFMSEVPLISLREALMLHALAIVVGPVVALIPRAFDAGVTVQRIFGMAALLICGSIASYCGLFNFNRQPNPRDLLDHARTRFGMIGLFFDFFPPHPRALIGGLFRIAGGPFLMFFFVLFLAELHTIPLNVRLALLLFGAAYLFQLGFLSLLGGLFTLRWWRGPDNVSVPPGEPPATIR